MKDASGRLWSVKLGIEAQSEVTASRILWAMGYPQPATYFVQQFTLTGVDAGVKTNARFRTDLEQWRAAGEWSWYENPFVNTQPFRGLIVAQLVLNNWDLKTSNNRIYEATDPAAMPRRQYMVRDVGSSLGHSKQFRLFAMLGTRGSQGSKNDVDDFEQQGFIEKVEGNNVELRLSRHEPGAGRHGHRPRRDLGVRAAREDSRRALAGGVQGRRLSAGAMPIATSARSRKRSRRVSR